MGMNERRRSSRLPAVVRGGAGLVAFAALGGCNVFDTDDNRPERARVQVEVSSAPSPLRLIVSTDFVELVDQDTGTILAALNEADTFALAAGDSFDQTFSLEELGSVLARLTETEDEEATVRMRVYLDGGLEYDRTGTLQDATIEYRFVYSNFF